MQILRKAVLFCAMVIAAIALTASPAAAQEVPVEIIDEPSGEHCNPCIGHAVGSSALFVFGIPISSCQDEFEAEVYEDGSGHIYSYENNYPNAGCLRINCSGDEGEWPVTAVGETGPNEGHSTVRFCLTTGGGGVGNHCTLEIYGFEQSLHDGVVTADPAVTCSDLMGVSIDGQWTPEFENHGSGEVIHADER
jgi:hypothetical protein